jgi:hypothetical protein
MRSQHLLLLSLVSLSACRSPDPRRELAVTDLETYWAVDPSRSGTQYLAPLVRFRLHNQGTLAQSAIQATATFHHKGDEKSWGSDWKQVAAWKKPLGPGQDVFVELKSDAHYSSTGSPAAMLGLQEFKDASVDVFVRMGASGWVRMAGTDVERRIGSKNVPPGS